MGNSWIFILLVVGWWAVQAIVSAAAKKKEIERQRELAERRRQMEHGGASQSQPSLSPASQSTQPTHRSQQGPTTRDDLAARRQAQLEELRRRRMQQSRGGSSGSTAVRTPTPAQNPTMHAPQTPPTSMGRGQMPVSFPRTTNVPQKPKKQKPAKQPARGKTQTARDRLKEIERERARREFHESSHKAVHKELRGLRDVPDVIQAGGIRPVSSDLGAPVGAVSPAARLSRTKQAPVDVNAMKQRFTSRSALRELFVMKELLDPPMALRDNPAGSF